jgi:branched-chain amino acid transport system substrate-binding protein
MTMKRRSFLLSTAAATGAAALPCVASAQIVPRPFQQQLNIAVNVPLSGSSGGAGREIANGVQAAIDFSNRYGGTFGSAFAMRTFDDIDALAQSMVNVQFAAADASVIAVVGGFDGSLIAASLPTYENAQMPLLVPGSTNDSVTARGYRNVWRLPTKDSLEGQLAAQFVAKREKPKLAIAVTQDGDYGSDVAQGFLNQSKSAGMTAFVYLFGTSKPNYDGAAKELIGKRPDFVYLCGVTQAMGPLIPALRGAGYKGKFGASQGFFNEPTLREHAQAFANGFISTSMPPLERAPDVAQALTEFRSRFGVTALSAFAYAAAQIIIAATRRSGANNRLTLMNALQSPSLYNTVVGSFQFAPTGDPIDPIVYFYRIVDSKFKFIAPSHATSFVL